MICPLGLFADYGAYLWEELRYMPVRPEDPVKQPLDFSTGQYRLR